jgi:Holliday junction DNA helicase RuvA
MLEGIEGTVIERRDSEAVIQTGGFFLRVNCTPNTLAKLNKGETAFLFTYMAYSQDRPPELYGFRERDELDLFNVLLKMSKVGPKSALKILSATSPARLKNMIASRSIGELARLPGVGKKTAERMVTELSYILGAVEVEEAAASMPDGQRSAREDTVIALVSLGFDEQQARKTVLSILKKDQTLGPEELIRLALKEIRSNL